MQRLYASLRAIKFFPTTSPFDSFNMGAFAMHPYTSKHRHFSDKRLIERSTSKYLSLYIIVRTYIQHINILILSSDIIWFSHADIIILIHVAYHYHRIRSIYLCLMWKGLDGRQLFLFDSVSLLSKIRIINSPCEKSKETFSFLHLNCR